MATGHQKHGGLLDEKPSGGAPQGFLSPNTHIKKIYKGDARLSQNGNSHDGKGVLDLVFSSGGKGIAKRIAEPFGGKE